MKRFTLITLCLLVACAMLFACCSSTPQTKTLCRWEDERLSYVISLVDTKTPHNLGTDVYLKDYATVISNDEIIPQDVTGTLDVSITKSNGTYTYETHQTVYLGFNATDYEKIKDLEGLSALEKLPRESITPDLHYVCCQTDTMVEFDEQQLPIKSSKEIHGIYASNNGRSTITNTKIETTYDLKEAVAKVKIDNGEEVSCEIGYKKGAKFIDANQLAIYARSFNKNESDFQDSPTATVYEPMSNTSKTVYFTNFKFDDKVYLANATACAKLSSVCVYLDSPIETSKLMYISSVPSSLKNSGLDCIFSDGTNSYSKLTPITMSVGYLSYELNFDSLTGGSAILESITAQ